MDAVTATAAANPPDIGEFNRLVDTSIETLMSLHLARRYLRNEEPHLRWLSYLWIMAENLAGGDPATWRCAFLLYKFVDKAALKPFYRLESLGHLFPTPPENESTTTPAAAGQ